MKEYVRFFVMFIVQNAELLHFFLKKIANIKYLL